MADISYVMLENISVKRVFSSAGYFPEIVTSSHVSTFFRHNFNTLIIDFVSITKIITLI